MNSRGSAYIFVVVVTMLAAVLLAAALNTTAYEARVSKSYRNHANLTLLAESGAERMARLVNNRLDSHRGTLSRQIAAELPNIDKASSLYIEKFRTAALDTLTTSFGSYTETYEITASADTYTVSLTSKTASGGFEINVTASKAGQPGAEELTAYLTLTDDIVFVLNKVKFNR